MACEISSTVLQRIIAEADADPAREICGLLFGAAGRIDAAQRCRNVAANPADSFEIDPQALIAAHKAARAGGPIVIGCYHAHPNGVPTPSARDADAAAPDGSIWLIVASGEALAWRSVGQGAVAGRFEPLTLIVR